MTVARDLAEFLTATSIRDLPAPAVDYAAMLIASTFASAALGREIESAVIMRDLARDRGGRPDATVWYDRGTKLPVAEAAQVNAVMSDAAASDDSDLRAIVHCGTPLSAAALAIAERDGCSGDDVLAAIVLGYEAAGRIGDGVTPGFRDRGMHGCLVASFAAAVCAARLMRLDARGMSRTIALAATSIGGLAAAANTSVAREYHGGLATLLGVHAALAAQRGFAAEEAILECKGGFFDAYGPGDRGAVLRDLGESWDIVTDMAVKLVPGGHPYHALGEAAANAARIGNVVPEEVEAIVVARPGLTALTGPRHPKDLIDMAHSPAYFTAAGVADRSFGWVHATPQKIADPVIHRLIDKVSVGAPPSDPEGRYRQGATVTIRTHDGRSFTSTVYAPRGSGLLGIDWADIEAKYRALMPHSGLPAERIEASLDLIRGLRGCAGVAPLMAMMRG
jgi:2-methylcitrate dehydratase PrpD